MIVMTSFDLIALFSCGIVFGVLGFRYLYRKDIDYVTATVVAIDSFYDNLKRLGETKNEESYRYVLEELAEGIDDVFELISEYRESKYSGDIFSILDKKSHRPVILYNTDKIKQLLFFKSSFELLIDYCFRLSKENPEQVDFEAIVDTIKKYSDRFDLSLSMFDKSTGSTILEI